MHYVFERALGKVHDSIREGETFATPLREAKVEVKEIPGKPGSYNAVAYLRLPEA
jgi:predicted component of type VI protein secretion system